MLVAPEAVEGDGMNPTISDGQWIVLMKESYSEKRGTPERGQVIVLDKLVTKELREGTEYKNDNLVARVVALPGETVREEELLGDYPGPVVLSEKQIWIVQDNWPLGLSEEEYKGQYLDSRVMGPVDLQDIRGKAKWIVWPLSNLGGVK
jgi:signal peptidase I